MSAEPAEIRAALEPLEGRLVDTVVALDFDGVLAPIVERPEDATALPGTTATLRSLVERVAQIAVVTGRPATDAVRLGALDTVPGVVVLGHYGLQRWDAGRLDSPDLEVGVPIVRERAFELAATRPGVYVEDKGHSVALHTRNAADPGGVLEDLRPHAEALAAENGLQLTPGRFVLELRPAGVDKGAALRSLVEQTGATAVLYAGDDLGDLPAVTAVRELAASGVIGLVVCADAEEASAELRTAADLVVDGPAGVQEVLRELATLAS
ncbi:trehalose 6-phosphatase [Haloactinopolyspora alba]|uniref:Trehalose 6-phosphate phosphatase n=1 Tax=Haloactinopolyspora alba TaxID=648780 RepID=A0A2P8DZ80_9ACTN|nr:trehalose-phosphatase [Haloactinopolyspora alba]PSL02525.1 trehalose 6-phosphatase [Haloactinopolyspora alba]